jgi:hypothetical protein
MVLPPSKPIHYHVFALVEYLLSVTTVSFVYIEFLFPTLIEGCFMFVCLLGFFELHLSLLNLPLLL